MVNNLKLYVLNLDHVLSQKVRDFSSFREVFTWNLETRQTK